jgi:hypothetical protein
MAREDPYKLPASDHSLDALNVAALGRMVTAPNAGEALPLGGLGNYGNALPFRWRQITCERLMGQK